MTVYHVTMCHVTMCVQGREPTMKCPKLEEGSADEEVGCKWNRIFSFIYFVMHDVQLIG